VTELRISHVLISDDYKFFFHGTRLINLSLGYKIRLTLLFLNRILKMFSRIIIPKSNPEQFEETAKSLDPHFFRLNLIDGQLDIMPVHNATGIML
jgi:hypothetical protein